MWKELNADLLACLPAFKNLRIDFNLSVNILDTRALA